MILPRRPRGWGRLRLTPYHSTTAACKWNIGWHGFCLWLRRTPHLRPRPDRPRCGDTPSNIPRHNSNVRNRNSILSNRIAMASRLILGSGPRTYPPSSYAAPSGQARGHVAATAPSGQARRHPAVPAAMPAPYRAGPAASATPPRQPRGGLVYRIRRDGCGCLLHGDAGEGGMETDNASGGDGKISAAPFLRSNPRQYRIINIGPEQFQKIVSE